MADAIKRKTGDQATLVEGGGGVFDVEVDGRVIFSKHDLGRFPEDEEILAQLE